MTTCFVFEFLVVAGVHEQDQFVVRGRQLVD